MSTRAVVAKRGVTRNEKNTADELTTIGEIGFRVITVLPYGILIEGSLDGYQTLERRGFFVKVYFDTNLLQVGSYTIDIDKEPPELPPDLRVPPDKVETWLHYLIQLDGPRDAGWLAAIRREQIEIVEPISRYGLFVLASPQQIRNLAQLKFVTWTGQFQPGYRVHRTLLDRKGPIRFVSIGVYPPSEAAAVHAALNEWKALVRTALPPHEYDGKYSHFIVEVDASHIPAVAALPGVRWLGFASDRPAFDGERETQIVAGNLDIVPPYKAPVVGYQSWLATMGLNGAGVTVAICDTGVDAGPNNNLSGHLDLRGRQTAFVDYTLGLKTTDTDGHGTHVAGIIVGNAATNQTETGIPGSFLWGQGMAPLANYVTQNFGPFNRRLPPPKWPPTDWDVLTKDSIDNGAQVQNNSWKEYLGVLGYSESARRFDQLVRDPDPDSAELQFLIIVFSAGNDGSNPQTITPPHEAKNPITVGNSLTYRPGDGIADDIRGIFPTSSRGPAQDGRILPHVVAPGTRVSSALSKFSGRTAITGTGTVDPANPMRWLNAYTFVTGTSMSAAFVSGACALLVQWWRIRTGGGPLSPAMAKALLINGAEDCAGGPNGQIGGTNPILNHIPNNHQGWGRVSLENILLQHPNSDRGPKIFIDQSHAFTANGQSFTIRVSPFATTRHMRITLVWTDAAGSVTNTGTALVNNLNLEVHELATGNIFKGNNFNNGFSASGGFHNQLDNIECVYLEYPDGTYEVTVHASNISESAHPHKTAPWQDFALVIDNAEAAATAPTSVAMVIDRSGSMISSGFVNVTRTSGRQFIDLLGVDDRLAVVTFGDDANIEFPTGTAATLQTITGQLDRDVAKTAVDAFAFGGCTNTGAGINAAKDILNPVSGSRAIVLLSDGYDNKGCDPTNPAKPSALDAVASLPANLPVHTCAMGPASDYLTMEQIAQASSGKYFYMPNIDDLFEIYNYIRAIISGDSIVVNDSALASSSRVGVLIDAPVVRAKISVAWANNKLKYAAGDPNHAESINIRLRNPRGQLIHENSSHVRRSVGNGYVLFEMHEPAPGRWYVEVKTHRRTHVRYTVGGFVQSPIRLELSVPPNSVDAGMPLRIASHVVDGERLLQDWQQTGYVVSPVHSLSSLARIYDAQLAKLRPVKVAGGDSIPMNIAKLFALQAKLIKEKQADLFSHAKRSLKFSNAKLAEIEQLFCSGHFEAHKHLAGMAGVKSSEAQSESSARLASFSQTAEQGSYNAVLTATGLSPISNSRFVRKQLISIVVR
jgi:subtilisin family serine protease/Mg-chelatase subunit ChlD